MKKIIFLTTTIIAIIIAGYLFIVFFLPFQIAPFPSSTIYLDRNNQEIGEVIYSGSIRHREMTFEEIPEFSIQSLIALEDQTFYDNNGISLR
jgi:membrane peptidoglycan carboxypeptidase